MYDEAVMLCNFAVQWLTLWLYIRLVLSSALGSEADFRNRSSFTDLLGYSKQMRG
jgi:hypothetical protein